MKRRQRSPAYRTSENNASLPKYTIGVVSQLLGLPPQVLRRYEEAGLLAPARQHVTILQQQVQEAQAAQHLAEEEKSRLEMERQAAQERYLKGLHPEDTH